MTRVLPDPAPARTSSGPVPCVTASRCWGLSPVRSIMSSGGAQCKRWCPKSHCAVTTFPPLERPIAASCYLLAVDYDLFSTGGFMFGLGFPELLLILIIVVVV